MRLYIIIIAVLAMTLSGVILLTRMAQLLVK